MKRFLAVLFALGLVLAISQPASAVDVKFSGYYSVWGFYQDNQSLGDGADESASDAFYSQRMRLNTVFQVAEGLQLNAACDIMEKVWGAHREGDGYSPGDGKSEAWDEENIDFDKLYVSFALPVGMVYAGYMMDNQYGTVFGDDIYTNLGIVRFATKIDNWTLCAWATKGEEGDLGSDETDADSDWYTIFANYKADTWEAGLLYRYYNDATMSSYVDPILEGADMGYKLRCHVLTPFAKATFGPVYVEGQIYYAFADDGLEWEDDSMAKAVGAKDIDIDSLAAYVMAKVNLDRFYVGAQFAYVQGDDDPYDDEINDVLTGGTRYNPCLILWNWELNHWTGALGGVNGHSTGAAMENALFYQLFAGCSPIEKLDVKASISYAEPDEKVDGNDDEYGTEIDITATYKIYDNLAYTVGFGYLWTGDYFEGPDAVRGKVDDNYIVMNNLKLTF